MTVDVEVAIIKVEHHLWNVRDENDYVAQTQKYIDFGFTVNPYKEGESYQYVIDSEEATRVIGPSELVEYFLAGFSLEVKGKTILKLNPADVFKNVEQKQHAIANTADVYNTRCEVHIPGQALATYNEIRLLENSCTDILQEALNSGWRIIAACPQPNQRRPDYILGRYNPSMTIPGEAER